jgi:hypothetical protein
MTDKDDDCDTPVKSAAAAAAASPASAASPITKTDGGTADVVGPEADAAQAAAAACVTPIRPTTLRPVAAAAAARHQVTGRHRRDQTRKRPRAAAPTSTTHSDAQPIGRI